MKKINKKIIFIAIIIVVAIFGVGFILYQKNESNKKLYDESIVCVINNEYEKCNEILNNLNGYKDSDELLEFNKEIESILLGQKIENVDDYKLIKQVGDYLKDLSTDNANISTISSKMYQNALNRDIELWTDSLVLAIDEENYNVSLDTDNFLSYRSYAYSMYNSSESGYTDFLTYNIADERFEEIYYLNKFIDIMRDINNVDVLYEEMKTVFDSKEEYLEKKYKWIRDDFSNINPNYSGKASEIIREKAIELFGNYENWVAAYNENQNKFTFVPAHEVEILRIKKSQENIKPKPALNMTEEEVLNSSWGEPDDINVDYYTWGTTEQWVYSSRGYIYFENGVVTAIQER
ncbi:hypothetical protein [Traorella massiliensis]|uniref:hypothetical protein n=2 Tax=Traorella massiliensis TaxID=1903263 RepID=UPI002356C061|nr:hypothetical protein [Traorella massiliensis]